MWLLTIILPDTVIWTKPSFAVRDCFPWEQWNNLYSAQYSSMGMICIRDRNISLALCSRIASRKVLLVLNWLTCWDKILQLPLCVGAGYMGGQQTHICNRPGFSCLTYTINSEETSQTLFSWRLRVCSSLHDRWKNSIIFTGFWIGSIPACGECSQLLRCRNGALSICKKTHQTQGMWGPIFINAYIGMEKTWIQSKCKKLVSLATILSWLEYFPYRSSKITWIMKSVSMSCHIMSCPVLLEPIWKQQ